MKNAFLRNFRRDDSCSPLFFIATFQKAFVATLFRIEASRPYLKLRRSELYQTDAAHIGELS